MLDTDKDKEEIKIQKELAEKFQLIGRAPTRYTRKIKIFNLNKYRAKIQAGALLNAQDSKVKEHLVRMEQRSEQASKDQMQQQNIMLGGAFRFVPLIVDPFSSSMLAIFRGQRLGHNILKIILALALVAAVTLAIIYLPVFAVPFIEFVATFFGKTATFTAGLVGFGFAFKVAEFVLDRMQPVPDYVLRLWKEQTQLDENVVNIMQQYLMNAEKVSSLEHIKNMLISIRKHDMAYPTPESLQKLVIFFSKQLLKLRKEKLLLTNLQDRKQKTQQLAQVNLDIKALTFVLNKLATVASLPFEAQILIEERLDNPNNSDAHRLRKELRRAQLAASEPAPNAGPPFSFPPAPSAAAPTTPSGKSVSKPRRPKTLPPSPESDK